MCSSPLRSTPIEQVLPHVWVKREDLCCPPPGPPFSKMRGVIEHMQSRPESLVACLDTFHSKGGWAVAYAAQLLGKQSITFWPKYKADGDKLRVPQLRAQALGAELIALPAGRSAILYHRARKVMGERGGYLFPNALKLPEMVEVTAREVKQSDLPPQVTQPNSTWVISISSATISAGVMVGAHRLGIQPKWVLHMGYSRSESAVRSYLVKQGVPPETAAQASIINEGFSYRDQVTEPNPPFRCSPYYDRKAWAWLMNQLDSIRGNVLFWNIGA